MNKTLFIIFIAFVSRLSAQDKDELLRPPFTPATERIVSQEKRQSLLDGSLVKKVPFRNIGPTVFSGRVVDIDVWEKDPTHFFVAYASGGLWKTTNNGTTFEPIFDKEMVMTIGDIAVDWARNIIWVGTGENNSSRSSYAGVGIYRSTDGGKTWEHRGLGESHHIGRIALHPKDPNTIWVAAMGHLYSPNRERGIYKSTDGGKTWKQTLYVDDQTGAIDLVRHPINPNVLYAATWQRDRKAWDFQGAGKGSGIYKSVNGGESWTRITKPGSGFPVGEGLGRIGLDVIVDRGKVKIFALVDNQNLQPKKPEEDGKNLLTKEDFRSIAKDSFLKIEDKQLEKYLRGNGFPEKYSAEKVKLLIRSDSIAPIALVDYLEDANASLFDTEVIGGEVYLSDNEGISWSKTHSGLIEDFVYSYGYYFGQIRVSPSDGNRVYVGGVPILISTDGGKKFKSINGDNVHVDHHALWVNPKRAGHLINGNDGGINISYDDGASWIKCNSPAVGQFYTVAVDMAKPYNVYGGTQDNGVWMGPSTYEAGTQWQNTGDYPYDFLSGGDGMQVAIDNRDNSTVYTGYQFGHYFRINTRTKERKYITPKHELGERPYRWNWQTPIHLSLHNQDIFYMGSNKLHRSFDQGNTWESISGDLTSGGKKGNVPFGTLTTIHESPIKFGLIYTGSDDGLVYVTKDGGHSWENRTIGLPENYYISRVQASQHAQSRVFVALNGYRWDNFSALIFASEDFGKTWKRLGRDLPLESVNVIREDPNNPDLLYIGTDRGVYISLDRGTTFMEMDGGIPAVPVHDLVVHPREKELVIGTHGRSIYIADVSHLQQLVDSVRQKELFVFELGKVNHRPNWGNSGNVWKEPSIPEFKIPVYLSKNSTVEIAVMAGDSLLLKKWQVTGEKGINYFNYDLSFDDNQKESYTNWLNQNRKKGTEEIVLEAGKRNGIWYLQKGTYRVIVRHLEKQMERTLTIEGKD